jgi:hypothetical protein
MHYLYLLFPTAISALTYPPSYFIYTENINGFRTKGTAFNGGGVIMATETSFWVPDYHCGVRLCDAFLYFMSNIMCFLCLLKERAIYSSISRTVALQESLNARSFNITWSRIWCISSNRGSTNCQFLIKPWLRHSRWNSGSELPQLAMNSCIFYYASFQ